MVPRRSMRLALALLAWALPLSLRPAQPIQTLLCLGDSLTAGYGLEEAQAWPALLERRLQRSLPGWRVANGGASGDTSREALRRLDWLLRSRPRAALVCVGANDGLRGLPLELLKHDLARIVRRLQASGAAVYVAGMDLPSNFGADYRRDFRALYPSVATEQKVDLMPFLLDGVAGRAELNLSDGVHPNAEGQRLVAMNVERFLLPRLAALPPRTAAAAGPKVLRSRKDLEQTP